MCLYFPPDWAKYALYAGVAQLVERDLAKVEVTSSSLVTRSKFPRRCRSLTFNLFLDFRFPSSLSMIEPNLQG